MSMPNQITDLLAIKHPILLAPMAGISGGKLAASVSRAGGLGFIGAGYGESDWICAQIELCKGVQIGFGFITWALKAQPKLLAQALAVAPRAIFLSFGEISEFAKQIRDSGAVLIAQVQTVQQAREAVAQGAQIIVAQGGEAGGHGGLRGTLALVPAVVDAVHPIPVAAAGGIADGRGFAAVKMLGASGIVCGTAFYAAEESLAHDLAKQRVVEASGDDTLKSPVFDMIRDRNWPPGPWQLRTLRNKFSERWADAIPELRTVMSEETYRYHNAQFQGDFDIAATIVGEATDLVKSVTPAAQIIQSMVDQCNALLNHSH